MICAMVGRCLTRRGKAGNRLRGADCLSERHRLIEACIARMLTLTTGTARQLSATMGVTDWVIKRRLFETIVAATFRIDALYLTYEHPMRHLLLIFVAGTLATGCSHMQHQAITTKDLANLNNQAIVQTSVPVPGFAVLKFQFAVTNPPTIDDALIRSAGIVDPAIAMGATLAASLASANGARILPQRIAVTGAEVGQIADAARSSARYVLDVRTFSWLLTYLPTAWNSYGLAYTATARLIDTQTNTIAAQGYCNEGFDKTIDPPTYHAMVANQAARLKRELSIIAQACTKTFSTQMSLGTPGPMLRPASPAVAQQARPASADVARPVYAAPLVTVAPVVQQSMVVAQQTVPAAQLSRPLDAYELALAEMREKHNRLDPQSVYFSQDAFDWIIARQAEHMQRGLSAPAALRRAVENMERP